jgi:hypothetical protein
MPRKSPINKVNEKIKESGLNSLNYEEMLLYIQARAEKSLSANKVLTPSEFYYLLSETGPGNLRIDPEYLHLLFKKELYLDQIARRLPEFNEVIEKKLGLEKKMHLYINSSTFADDIKRVLQRHVQKTKIHSISPLIISGEILKIQIRCLILNGDWILPDTDIYSFINKCRGDKTFPIFIAKKIHGVMFPAFKNLSILGLATHKTIATKDIVQLASRMSLLPNLLWEFKYHDQFMVLNKRQNPAAAVGISVIDDFFARILKNNIHIYNENFQLNKFVGLTDFKTTVSLFRKNKVTKKIIQNLENREKIINSINKDAAHIDI